METPFISIFEYILFKIDYKLGAPFIEIMNLFETFFIQLNKLNNNLPKIHNSINIFLDKNQNILNAILMRRTTLTSYPQCANIHEISTKNTFDLSILRKMDFWVYF